MITGLEKIVREMIAAWNAHDLERLSALYAADYQGVDLGQTEPQQGPQGARQSAGRFLAAFPDLSFSAADTVCHDNRIVLCWTIHGSHRGTLMNIPPSGREVTIRGVSLFTVNGDKIAEGYHLWDLAGLLRAMRLLPDL
ncbi:MAG: ester cyclase [Chloroflexi bacterium]|nr:ester cyclase [Chloroflexota bacterium]MCI0576357.1 ester cyclase [Chloroflexota bacterium]MCI0646190.1 ester cyclase [Chloroflexota bacterium]MCI0726748.1 ester cyclase [Chloroflexota bacterium]